MNAKLLLRVIRLHKRFPDLIGNHQVEKTLNHIEGGHLWIIFHQIMAHFLGDGIG